MAKQIEVRGLALEDFGGVADVPRIAAVTIDGRILAYGEVKAVAFVDGGVCFTVELPQRDPTRVHPPMAYVDPYETPIEIDREHSQR